MHLKPISNSLRRKLYSVKYRKGSARDEDYAGGVDSGVYAGSGGGGMGRGDYSEYENGMMSGIGGGTYYDGTSGRGGGGQHGRERNDERGRDRSGERGSKRGRHDRDSGRRRH